VEQQSEVVLELKLIRQYKVCEWQQVLVGRDNIRANVELALIAHNRIEDWLVDQLRERRVSSSSILPQIGSLLPYQGRQIKDG
jgi:hypothetical protein